MAVRCLRVLFTLLVMSILSIGPAGAQSGDTPAADSGDIAAGAAEAQLPPEAQALLDVLRNPEARDALIARLEAVAAPQTAGEAAAETVDEVLPGTTTENASFGRRVAVLTQDIATTVTGELQQSWSRLQRSGSIFTSLSGRELDVLFEALTQLAAIIVATVVVFTALRMLARPIYGRMGARADGAPLLRTVLLYAGSAVMDVLIVVIAWLAGYAIATLVLGDFGQVGIRQALYLNAFLLVEMAKVGVRLLFSPATEKLRILPLADGAARYLSGRINIILSVLGYGQLLVIPILNQNVSFAAGRSVSAILALAVLIYLVGLVLHKRQAVTEWLLGDEEAKPKRNSLKTLARSWHLFALAYLLVMFFIVMTQPGPQVFTAIFNSFKVAGVIVLGIIVSNAMTKAIKSGFSLPSGLHQRLPLLEVRLNQFVRRALTALRVVIVIAVALIAADLLGFLDVGGWFETDLGLRASGMVVSVTLILLGAFAVWLALSSWVDYRLNPDFGSAPSSREKTLLTLLRNAATIALVIVTLMFVLAEIGLNIGPLLASAGVLGLAIGFGAQKMVQDIITGVFIQFENAMNVGDVVTVGGTTGTVEKLTIRSVSLRDLQGSYHIIPFSSVDMVTNYMRDFAYCVADMGVAYREDVGEVKQAMFDAFEELRGDEAVGPNIIAEMEWFGLNSFGDSAIVLRSRIKTKPGAQWGVGRAYNAICKRIFDERGIEIPFPYQTITFAESKSGATQAIKIASAKASDKETQGGQEVIEGTASEPDHRETDHDLKARGSGRED
ncbi:mechanosensitive ion channel domain-containing protein [Anianabacter salinae]|uniref:mechanosensitive ion channel domain-containing protein n=1 Tax=Anianabacter salinae TaxID=2851023 RepID=UPI00225E4F21|nr:mechanosensitive ion channel domain-containing protein [Anianabacter salinae]MBV0910929.1 mechanosensitive ion channel [Anianabacter salinae]